MREQTVTYSIIKRIGVLKEFDTGWKRELNIVSWNGGSAKFDIRDWDANHEKMSRGLTFHQDEIERLIQSYTEYSLNNL